MVEGIQQASDLERGGAVSLLPPTPPPYPLRGDPDLMGREQSNRVLRPILPYAKRVRMRLVTADKENAALKSRIWRQP